MSTEFLDILYKQEAEVYDKIMKNPLYEELSAIQKLIQVKGGTPRFLSTVASGAARVEYKGPVSISYKSKNVLDLTDYEETWTWDKKTEYGFKKIGGRGTPKKVIETIIQASRIKPNDSDKKHNVAANVYNAITKMKKDQRLLRDQSDRDNIVYILSNEEALLLDNKAS